MDFQELRKKYLNKQTNEIFREKINYIFIAFDILYLNDEEIFLLNLEERKKILIENFFKKIPEIVIENGREIELNDNESNKEKFTSEIFEFYESARKLNCEGLIIKFLGNGTFYEFGKRKWLKVKKI